MNLRDFGIRIKDDRKMRRAGGGVVPSEVRSLNNDQAPIGFTVQMNPVADKALDILDFSDGLFSGNRDRASTVGSQE
ncbi:MAG: hypothetical protein KDN18_01465 [Verrucomicrobiae bacterium]|nr:hypothetical protein [Verrucomicrobiae bacterium]